MKQKEIGFGIKSPKLKKDLPIDKKSPFSGHLKVRGRSFIGTVISARMQRTASVEWTRRVRLPKYERYTIKRTKIKAHNPDEIKAEEGDIVKIIECRPLSKTKHFVIVEKYGKERRFIQRMESLEESKKKKEERVETEAKTE